MESKASPLPTAGVQISALFLKSMRFDRLPDVPGAVDAEIESSFGLGVGRPTQDSLNVELSVALEKSGTMRMEVTYLVQFKRAEGHDVENEDEFWRTVASQVAPVVIYPYIREVVTAVTGRGGLPPLILPVVNFIALFDPGEIALPPVDTT